MQKERVFDNERNKERLLEIREVIGLISNNLAMPLYLVFWVCDLVYIPDQKWTFLALRLSTLPLCVVVRKVIAKAKTYKFAQNVCLVFITLLALIINIMVFIADDWGTPYYAGLNLVALGTLSFIPWSKVYYFVTGAAIYSPYLIWGITKIAQGKNFAPFFISLFFIVGTVTISFIMRYFNESLRKKDLASRSALNEEINNRDTVIVAKAEEAVRLTNLSKQFSPQVVHAISEGKIEISNAISRTQICAIFIDIVNSTERITRVDKDDVNNVLVKFMEDTMKVLLKYDITIDKFLGDGVLAFSNAPIEHNDFVKRTVDAAIEIRNRITAHREYYLQYWLSELQIRIGISSGYANVGFYGSDEYFRSYTAIGRPVNLASRLCGAAEPSEIIISQDIAKVLEGETYSIKNLGLKKLKGFEQDMINVYSVIGSDSDLNSDHKIPTCPNGHGILHLDTNAKGFYTLMCRYCDYTPESIGESTAAKKAA